ncbi:MAG: hypothetical protein HYX84_08570 [Chloroflexi bacterium]|nr:hypothetical protein [Chloroflexota bacterium]
MPGQVAVATITRKGGRRGADRRGEEALRHWLRMRAVKAEAYLYGLDPSGCRPSLQGGWQRNAMVLKTMASLLGLTPAQ